MTNLKYKHFNKQTNFKKTKNKIKIQTYFKLNKPKKKTHLKIQKNFKDKQTLKNKKITKIQIDFKIESKPS